MSRDGTPRRYVIAEYLRAKALVQEFSDGGHGVVYVYRDANGTPLYVGQTGHLVNRLHGHKRSHWWNDATTIDVIRVEPMDQLAVEADLIRTLRPLHNGNGS